MVMAAATGVSAWAAEYEVDGKLSQTTVQANGGKLRGSASFTVFVRDGGWLIQTTETNENGDVVQRETGSTNTSEIYELVRGSPAAPPPGQDAPPARASATIIPNNVPVGQLDNAVTGHLWLMFASQGYWTNLKSDRLTPVYEWQASVASRGQTITVPAQWELLAGPGSLPREVRYLGEWQETNGLYKVTGTNSAGGTLIPSGFFFEERHVGSIPPDSLVHEMALRKRVDVEVTAVRPVCSRASLLPSPLPITTVIDYRLGPGVPLAGSTQITRPPSYRNPTPGQWLTLDGARKLVQARQDAAQNGRSRSESAPSDVR
jgi:hypothetical protein